MRFDTNLKDSSAFSNSNTKPPFFGKLISLKSMLVSISLVVLIATNIATLVSSTAHDFFHGLIWRVLSIGGAALADNALSKSPKKIVDQKVKVQTAELETKNKQLLTDNSSKTKQIDELKDGSKKLAQQLESNGKIAKETVAKVHKRLAKGVSRNVAALPGESVPYFGISILIASTTLDIYDACQTMKDFNSLLVLLGQGEENPELCGQKIPTVDEVISNAKTDWKKSAQAVNDEARKLQIKVSEVKPPTQKEIAMASCPIVKVPYLCSN